MWRAAQITTADASLVGAVLFALSGAAQTFAQDKSSVAQAATSLSDTLGIRTELPDWPT